MLFIRRPGERIVHKNRRRRRKAGHKNRWIPGKKAKLPIAALGYKLHNGLDSSWHLRGLEENWFKRKKMRNVVESSDKYTI